MQAPVRRPYARRSTAPSRATYVLVVVLSALAVLSLMPAWASAANFSWSGEGLASANGWSNGANWTGGTAPTSSASIGTLSFPVLNRNACFVAPTEACETAVNDLTGLSVNELQVDDADEYIISGNGFTLGSGGLSTTNHPGSGGFATIDTPITLGASQTWNVSGSGDGATVTGALSGSGSAFTVNLSPGASFALGGYTANSTDNEVGNVLVQGSSGDFWLDDTLNASDSHMLTVQGVPFFTRGATVGALEVTSSTTILGRMAWAAPEAALLKTASAVFSGGELAIPIVHTGTQPGIDYSQLSASGSVTLSGTTLNINLLNQPSGTCPTVPAGQTDVLVSATGSLTGTFTNAANGSIVSTECSQFRVEYHTTGSPQMVTATAVAASSAPTNSQPPTISGRAIEGQTLSEAHGTWSNSPTSYTYQWQWCDGTGNNCGNISGATSQTYTLTNADVGRTLRVQEIASNASGTSAPAVSQATGVVVEKVERHEEHKEESKSSGSTGGTGTSTGSSGGSSISTGQLKASLLTQLVPSGKAAKIPSLLKHGDYTMPFTAPEAGTVTVQWYDVPQGAKLAKKAKKGSKVKPILIASGKTTFSGAGSGKVTVRLTAAGKRILRQKKRLRLEAKATFRSGGGALVSVVRGFGVRG